MVLTAVNKIVHSVILYHHKSLYTLCTYQCKAGGGGEGGRRGGFDDKCHPQGRALAQ